jgi:hypothetical protein
LALACFDRRVVPVRTADASVEAHVEQLHLRLRHI